MSIQEILSATLRRDQARICSRCSTIQAPQKGHTSRSLTDLNADSCLDNCLKYMAAESCLENVRNQRKGFTTTSPSSEWAASESLPKFCFLCLGRLEGFSLVG